LNDASRKARGYAFREASDTLNNAMKAGYFDRAAHGQFKLNAVGENLVAMTLPGTDTENEDKRRSFKPKKRKTRKTTTRKK
jgi:hypothetical protein